MWFRKVKEKINLWNDFLGKSNSLPNICYNLTVEEDPTPSRIPEELTVRTGMHVIVDLIDASDRCERLEFDIVPDQVADFARGFLGEGTPLAQAIWGAAREPCNLLAGGYHQLANLGRVLYRCRAAVRRRSAARNRHAKRHGGGRTHQCDLIRVLIQRKVGRLRSFRHGALGKERRMRLTHDAVAAGRPLYFLVI